MSSLKKCLFRSSVHFLIGCLFFLILTCMSCLYILEINPSSVVPFAIILSHSEGECLFNLLYSFLCWAKAFKYNQVPFVYFWFYFPYSRRQVIEDLSVIVSKRVLPMFSSKSLIVSGLTFRSLIHFEFIFVHDVRKHSNFILLHVAVQFYQAGNNVSIWSIIQEHLIPLGFAGLPSMGSHGVGHNWSDLAAAADTKTQVQSLGQENPLEKGKANHSIFLPGEFHGQRSLAGYSPCGRRESDMTE